MPCSRNPARPSIAWLCGDLGDYEKATRHTPRRWSDDTPWKTASLSNKIATKSTHSTAIVFVICSRGQRVLCKRRSYHGHAKLLSTARLLDAILLPYIPNVLAVQWHLVLLLPLLVACWIALLPFPCCLSRNPKGQCSQVTRASVPLFRGEYFCAQPHG